MEKKELQIDRWERFKNRIPVSGDQQGVSLVIALLILLLLTLLGISAISTTTYETNIAGNEKLYSNAFYAGDAGVDYFFGNIDTYVRMYLNDPNAPIPQIGSKAEGLSLEGSEFNILSISPTDMRIINLGPPIRVEFKIISEGISPNFPVAGKVRIEAVIEGGSQEPPQEYPGGST